MLQSFCAMHPFWSNMCLTEAVMPEMQIICTICARNNFIFLTWNIAGNIIVVPYYFKCTGENIRSSSTSPTKLHQVMWCAQRSKIMRELLFN